MTDPRVMKLKLMLHVACQLEFKFMEKPMERHDWEELSKEISQLYVYSNEDEES